MTALPGFVPADPVGPPVREYRTEVLLEGSDHWTPTCEWGPHWGATANAADLDRQRFIPEVRMRIVARWTTPAVPVAELTRDDT